MKNTKEMKKNNNVILIIVILVVLALITGMLIFIINYSPKSNINVASRTNVINYFDERGITEYLNKSLKTNINWVDYGNDNSSVYERVKKDAEEAIKRESEGRDKDPNAVDAYLALGLTDEQMDQIAADIFMDITNLLLTETVELKYIVESDKMVLNGLKNKSGKIYSFPSMFETYADRYPQKVWINSEWLSNIGATVPTTTDEFYNILKQFKEQDVNLDEDAGNEIPLGVDCTRSSYSALGFIMTAFSGSNYNMTADGEFIALDNEGNVISTVTDEGFKEGIEYIKTLVDEGLLPEEVFTSPTDLGEKGARGVDIYGVIAATDINAIFGNIERAKKYVPVPPLKANGGEQYTVILPRQVRTGAYMINKQTENRQLMMKLGDAFMSIEGTLTVLLGEKGDIWTDADARDMAMGGRTALWKYKTNRISLNDKFIEEGSIFTETILPFWYSDEVQLSEQMLPDDQNEVELQNNLNWQGYLNRVTRDVYGVQEERQFVFKVQALLNHPINTEDQYLQENIGQISDYIFEETQKFISGEEDIEEKWEIFKSEVVNRRLEDIIRAYKNSLFKVG